MRTFTRALQLAVASSLGLPFAFIGCGSTGGSAGGGAGGSGAGGSGAGGSGAAETSSTGGQPPVVTCENPVDVGKGLARCANGLVIRNTVETCVPEPVAETCELTGEACKTAKDCTEKPNGVCAFNDEPKFESCYCSYGCVEDSDCSAGELCGCTGSRGECYQALCATNDDCEQGQVCGMANALGSCGNDSFVCTTDADECVKNEDCGVQSDDLCKYDGTSRKCVKDDGCVLGRPFLVDEAPRLARVAPRSDWQSGPSALYVDMDETTRFALAERWTEIALMEHASIAAFARFAMQLLALGAPAELISKTAKAMSDETRHAELAFGMASSLRGRAVGPGPLSMHHALESEGTPASLLRNVFREGCVGETIAALEAREGAERSGLGVLFQIASDESDHACLAWASVKWLVEQMGEEAADILEEELARAESQVIPIDRRELDLASFGHLTSEGRATLRAHALATLVRPATRALVERIRDTFEPPPETERVSMHFM